MAYDANSIEPFFTLTKPATLTFQGLFEARAIGPKGKEQGKPKFSANFELPLDHQDITALKAKAVEIARARWPGRDIKELKFPFLNGDTAADKAKKNGKDREFSRGKFIVVSRSIFEPKLSYVEGARLVTDLEGPARVAAKAKFYNGVLAGGQFKFEAYDGVGANPDGVTAYLQEVCSLGVGERIKGSGGGNSAETFKGYIGTSTDYDPTGGADGLDDEIPF